MCSFMCNFTFKKNQTNKKTQPQHKKRYGKKWLLQFRVPPHWNNYCLLCEIFIGLMELRSGFFLFWLLDLSACLCRGESVIYIECFPLMKLSLFSLWGGYTMPHASGCSMGRQRPASSAPALLRVMSGKRQLFPHCFVLQ